MVMMDGRRMMPHLKRQVKVCQALVFLTAIISQRHQVPGHARGMVHVHSTKLKNDCACVPCDPVGGCRRENLDSSSKRLMWNQSQKGDVILSIFYMTLRVFTFQNALFIFVGLRLVVLIAETSERQRDFVYFIDPLLCIVASRAAFAWHRLLTSR